MFWMPVMAGLALRGHQNWPHGAAAGRGSSVRSIGGALNCQFSGRPASSAATSVKILNVDPAW